MKPTCALLLAALAALSACGREKNAPTRPLPEMDLDALDKSRGKDPQIAPVVDQFEYLYKEGDRKTLLRAARAEPGPQDTKLLTQPRATLALAPHRVLVLTAAKATFTMPGNQPRDGLFSGDAEHPVVFTLYECPEGRAPDLSNENDIRMKVFFEGDARFDLERDGVQSDAPVQVTGRTLDFRGSGLQLTWNRLEQRMEQLDIARGEILRHRVEEKGKEKEKEKAAGQGKPRPKFAAGDAAQKRRDARSLYQPGERDLELRWDGPLTLRPATPADDASDETMAKAKANPRYDAVLTGRIDGHLRAQAAQDEAFFTGSRLDTQFTLAGNAVGDDKKKTEPVPVPAGEDNLLLQGDAAAPATVRTGRGDAISGLSLAFARGSGRVAAKGSAENPVTLRTPEGWLTGTRLDLDPGTGKAFVYGPGQLEAQTELKEAGKKDAGKAARPAAPLRVAYADHIEMDFTTEKPKPGDTPRLGEPVETRLFGRIKGEHPDFALACGRLAIGFEKDAAAGKGKVNPARVDLSEGQDGPAPVVTLRDPKQGTVTIKAPTMRLALETAGGRTGPSGFTANGPVEAVQGDGSVLACDRLDVDFVPPGAAGETKDAKGAVAALHATGHARYAGKADGKQANLEGDHFTVDARKETLELTGTAQTHARVESQGMSLSGEHVSLKKEGGVARVAGPGRLTLLTKDKQHLVVSWQGKMGWDDAQGAGYFEKQVDCAADSPQGASTLHADDSLRLLVDPGSDKAAGQEAAKNRDIRLADARGNVLFAGTQLDDGGQMVGRVRVDGPNLVVKNEATEKNPQGLQTIAVAGKGLMLVENFDDKGRKSSGPDALAGQGATYFSWKKSMLMDLAAGTMHLQHDVEIRHVALKADRRYAPQSEAVILNGQEARAALTQGGGLGGLHGRRKPEAKAGAVEMREMTCDHGVALRKGTARIDCDHLRYDGGKKQADLWSDPPRKVELSAKGQETPASADRVIWHADTDTLDVTRPAGGAVPQWK